MQMSAAERRAIEEKAEILKVISHPVRLCIVSGLLREPCCTVGKIHGCLDLPQSTVSQHLARLKSAGIVVGEREGTEVRYRVINKDVIKIIHCLMSQAEPNSIEGGWREK